MPRQQTRSHAVHGDAVIGRVDRGKDPYDLCYALAPRFKKRVRAILPGAPRYEGCQCHVLRKQPSGLEDTQRQADCERGTQLFAAAEILR